MFANWCGLVASSEFIDKADEEDYKKGLEYRN